ncbi:hypothetical protein [Candidatus Sneabacter namystus]|uniref:Uncharacterized protein n=1 Tax=Candidatus Sneabacter namystus TaxID=2601646 RepID=A0A5C0UIL8_9RICK|nr:hypothetical protein [Candidatus Sneabacter namystus]QEK39363.1 hypothetical protein FZC37_00160 [Candidatus Sneabacter namystus]
MLKSFKTFADKENANMLVSTNRMARERSGAKDISFSIQPVEAVVGKVELARGISNESISLLTFGQKQNIQEVGARWTEINRHSGIEKAFVLSRNDYVYGSEAVLNLVDTGSLQQKLQVGPVSYVSVFCPFISYAGSSQESYFMRLCHTTLPNSVQVKWDGISDTAVCGKFNLLLPQNGGPLLDAAIPSGMALFRTDSYGTREVNYPLSEQEWLSTHQICHNTYQDTLSAQQETQQYVCHVILEKEAFLRKIEVPQAFVSIERCDYLPHPENIFNDPTGPAFLKLEFFTKGDTDRSTAFLNQVMAARAAVEHCGATFAKWNNKASESQGAYIDEGLALFSCLFAVTPSVDQLEGDACREVMQRHQALKMSGFIHYNNFIKGKETQSIQDNTPEWFQRIHKILSSEQRHQACSIKTKDIGRGSKVFKGDVTLMIGNAEKPVDLFCINFKCGDQVSSYLPDHLYLKSQQEAIEAVKIDNHVCPLSHDLAHQDAMLKIVGGTELLFSEISE